MKTLGYGVIGCGNVSDRHLDAVEQGAGMRLAAVVDKQVERAKQMAGKHPSRPVVYGDVDDGGPTLHRLEHDAVDQYGRFCTWYQDGPDQQVG